MLNALPYLMTAIVCLQQPTVVVGCVQNALLNWVLIQIIRQPRPHSSSYGMPSGHAQAAAYATAVARPSMKLPMLALTAVVAVQRVVEGYHTPLQVSVGLALGGLLGML